MTNPQEVPARSPTMDDVDLDDLEAKARAATPSPWQVGEHVSEVFAPCDCCGLIATCAQFGPTETPECYNSEFIVAAQPSTVLALIARIRELESRPGCCQ